MTVERLCGQAKAVMEATRVHTRPFRAALSLYCLASVGVAWAAPPPLEAFGALPAMSDVRISDDGRRLAWIESRDDGDSAIVFDIAAGKHVLRTAIPRPSKLRSILWAGDTTLLATVSITHRYYAQQFAEFVRTMAIPLDGAPARMLLMDADDRSFVTGAALLTTLKRDPRTAIMATYDYSGAAARVTTGSRLAGGRKDAGWRWSLFEVDTRSGKGRMLEAGTPFTDQWVVDSTGRAVARSEWQADKRDYRILARQGNAWKEIYGRGDGEKAALHRISPDGASLLALRSEAGGQRQLWRHPLDGTAPALVASGGEFDIDWVRYDVEGRVPEAVHLAGDGEVKWLDPGAEARHSAVARAFPGQRVQIHSRSSDARRMVARVDGPSAPAVHYLIDLDAKRADIVGEEYPGLVGQPLGETTRWGYAARDGTEIPAFLTSPAGAPDESLALIVLVHGGPADHDEFAFDWLAQFLASRGYRVLQPQFRGSTGYGVAFQKAGVGQWGGLMQDDVSDGVSAVIKAGLADPGRVCIVGGSYGGYAALAGATLTPELYACAVSINGVADLPRMLGTVRRETGEESDALAYWREHIGSASDPRIEARSPVRIAARARAPILLLHGTDDSVVEIGQSRAMAAALASAGKVHQLVELPGEDHWLSTAATRVRVLAEVERFLAASLQPQVSSR